MNSTNKNTLQWLLEGDPSIRFQVMRDLSDKYNENDIQRERENISQEGWGKRLLEKQDKEGTWAHGLYTPKWTSTTYTLLLLKRLGIPSHNIRYQSGNIIHHNMTTLSFPTRWRNKVITALDYFREINHEFDERLVDAINLVKKKENNGRWSVQDKIQGKTWFELEQLSEPSRWNTLKAIRILNWFIMKSV